nr:MAG TPA: hypothetical protein [Caudoviricetes sp.]
MPSPTFFLRSFSSFLTSSIKLLSPIKKDSENLSKSNFYKIKKTAKVAIFSNLSFGIASHIRPRLKHV